LAGVEIGKVPDVHGEHERPSRGGVEEAAQECAGTDKMTNVGILHDRARD
jgi:hypothetical protein